MLCWLKNRVFNVLSRFMNIVDLANQTMAVVAGAGNNVLLVYKSMARELLMLNLYLAGC